MIIRALDESRITSRKSGRPPRRWRGRVERLARDDSLAAAIVIGNDNEFRPSGHQRLPRHPYGTRSRRAAALLDDARDAPVQAMRARPFPSERQPRRAHLGVPPQALT